MNNSSWLGWRTSEKPQNPNVVKGHSILSHLFIEDESDHLAPLKEFEIDALIL